MTVSKVEGRATAVVVEVYYTSLYLRSSCAPTIDEPFCTLEKLLHFPGVFQNKT